MANKLTPQQMQMLFASMKPLKAPSNTVDNTGRVMPRPEENPASKQAMAMFMGQLQRKVDSQKRYINDAGPAPVYKNIGEKVSADLERERRQRDLEASIPNEKFDAWAENVGMPVADIAMAAEGLYSAPALLRALGSNFTRSELLSAGEGLAKTAEGASTAGRFNLERTAAKGKKDIIRNTIQDGGFNINTRGSSTGNLFNVNIKSPTGKILASRNPDGTYFLSFGDQNPFNAGKSMLKMKDQLAGKTIYETKSFSPDSYTNILKLKSKLPFEEAGYIPLNSENKNINFLNDLILKNEGEWSASAGFKSEEAAKEGAKRMDEYMAKLGENGKSKVVNNNGKFEVHVPNYKINIPERISEKTIEVLKNKK
jgi:hypothetical protein